MYLTEKGSNEEAFDFKYLSENAINMKGPLVIQFS